MKSEIRFADTRIEKALQELKKSNTEDKKLHKWIFRAFEDLEENAFCGIQLPKRLIPKVYINKYGIDNLGNMIYPVDGGSSIQYQMGR